MTTPIYTDAELEAMLDAGESDLVELKSAWNSHSTTKSRQAIYAFLNDFPGHGKPGVLFIGVNDQGNPVGIKVTDELIQKLTAIKLDGRILPPPSLVIEKRTLKGKDVAIVVAVPSDTPPVRLDGKIWIRVGTSRAIASPQDERILNERRQNLLFQRQAPFELFPVKDATLDALDQVLFERDYLPKAFSPKVSKKIKRNYLQHLSTCKMIGSAELPTPTVLGTLVLGYEPMRWLGGAYIQFMKIEGTALSGRVLDEARISGPVSEMVQKLDWKLASHNRHTMFHQDDLQIKHVWDYPALALAEITRNAIMHKEYEVANAPVRIQWFDDRIEIINGGGPFGDVTPENFGQPGKVSYRNPNLSGAMLTLGLVNYYGTGIELAQEAMRTNGSPPIEFDVQPTTITATLQKVPDSQKTPPSE